MKYACPVCGFDQMPFPPEDHNICSCCGTEFGYHDKARTHHDLREMWIARDCPWFSTRMPPPEDWNAYVQMLVAGLVDVTTGSPEGVAVVVNPDAIHKVMTASHSVGTIAA
jgi:hypothetical protein